MRRQLGQLSLADGLVEVVLAATGSWSGSRRWWIGERSRGCWARSMPRRRLLLQQWYRLSDPAPAKALSDRLSFRR